MNHEGHMGHGGMGHDDASDGSLATTVASVLHSVATAVMNDVMNGTVMMMGGGNEEVGAGHSADGSHHRLASSSSMDETMPHQHKDMPASGSHVVHGGMAGMGGMGGHGMKMYFNTDTDLTVLFYDWKISTTAGLVGSMIGIFLLAMLYEGLKFFREHLFKKYASAVQYSSVAVIGQDGKVVEEMHKIASNRIFSWPHAVQTLLHIVQVVISYFLMLIFMTYSVWLCLAVALGAGAGYFVFGWRKATVVDVTEHCH